MLSPYSTVDMGTVVSISSTIQISNRTFSNVAMVNRKAKLDSILFGSVFPPYRYDDMFWICADVGLIKIRFNHYSQDTLHRVWELQRWHIEK